MESVVTWYDNNHLKVSVSNQESPLQYLTKRENITTIPTSVPKFNNNGQKRVSPEYYDVSVILTF